MRLRLCTWNVNSVKARLPRLLEWLEQAKPDVLCVQETKVAADAFPEQEVAALEPERTGLHRTDQRVPGHLQRQAEDPGVARGRLQIAQRADQCQEERGQDSEQDPERPAPPSASGSRH